MDQRDFLAAKEAALRDSGIGTLGEKSVHAVLKAAYEPHGENREVAVGGYVADILGEDGIMGLFTGGFRAGAAGCSAALIFGYLASLIFKPKMKK